MYAVPIFEPIRLQDHVIHVIWQHTVDITSAIQSHRALLIHFRSERRITNYTVHCDAKTAPFYFCNNFVKSFYIVVIIRYVYRNKFGTI